MLKDPIIEEVRQVRHKIESECENDPDKYYQYLQQIQKKQKSRIVKFKPKPAFIKQRVAV